LGIQSEFVDPEFIHVNLDVTTNLFLNKTTVSASTLISQIRTAIENFFNLNLNKFDEDFYLSKLITSIDNTSTAITGTLIKISLQKRLEPTLNITNSFVGSDLIKMYNKIKPTGITSTSFNVIFNEVSTPAVIEDVPNESPPNNEGTGILVLKNANSDEILNTNIGSVNYSSGDISINSITPIGYSSDQTDLRINAELQEESYNITANRQQVIILDDSTLNSLVNRKSGLVINIANIL
jgi:hypothetical protein